VFEQVSKQTSTPIDYSEVPADARVTVALDKVPLWKAIHRICRASGKVMPEVDSDHVGITPGAVRRAARQDHGPLLRDAPADRALDGGHFGSPDRYERFNSNFHVRGRKARGRTT
jgi:hypothetical protein